MKKLFKVLPMILALTMVLGMGLALAEEASDATPEPTTTQESTRPRKRDKEAIAKAREEAAAEKEELQAKRQQLQEFKDQIKQVREQIQAKRSEIKATQQANRSLMQQIRARIGQLREQGFENLTQEQIDSIKRAGELLKEKAGKAGSIIRDNKGIWEKYRAAMKAGSYDEAKSIVSTMQSNYDAVLAQLNETGDALAGLLAALQ